MRESLFAVLDNAKDAGNGVGAGSAGGGGLFQKSFLDLFSGSGIIALEAFSRGASPVEAVENDAGKRAVLLANAALAGNALRCRFIPVERYVSRAKERSFDYIFCDPPFPYRYKRELISAIAASPLMRAESRLIIHYPRGDECGGSYDSLRLLERKSYGRSTVDFLQKL
jgi:16S rRNA (guanine(966)-N(2))-methyltransferase RsmD